MLCAASPNRKLFHPPGLIWSRIAFSSDFHSSSLIPIRSHGLNALSSVSGWMPWFGSVPWVNSSLSEMPSPSESAFAGIGAERGLLLVVEAVAVVVAGGVDDGRPVAGAHLPALPGAAGDRLDGARRPLAEQRAEEQQGRDDDGDEQQRAHVLGRGLAALAAQPGEQQRDGREQPGARDHAGHDDHELHQRPAGTDRLRDGQHQADGDERRPGADGPHHDDLPPAADARQRRLPGARDAAEHRGHEDDQRAGADLRHRGRDGVEQREQAAQQHEQRQQRRRHAGAGRPHHGTHSRCSYRVHAERR